MFLPHGEAFPGGDSWMLLHILFFRAGMQLCIHTALGACGSPSAAKPRAELGHFRSLAEDSGGGAPPYVCLSHEVLDFLVSVSLAPQFLVECTTAWLLECRAFLALGLQSGVTAGSLESA